MEDRGIVQPDGDARHLGMAWAEVLGWPGGSLLLAHRGRYGSTALAAGVARGLLEAGVDVVDLGLAGLDHLCLDSAQLGCPALLVTSAEAGTCRLLAVHDGIPGLDEDLVARLDVRLAELDSGLAPLPVPRAGVSRTGVMVREDTSRDYADHLRRQVDTLSLRPFTVVLEADAATAALAPRVLAGMELVVVHDDPGTAVDEHGADLAARLDEDHLQVYDELGHEVHTAALRELAGVQVRRGDGPDELWRFAELGGANLPLLALLRILAALGRSGQPLSDLAPSGGHTSSGLVLVPVTDPDRALRAVREGFGHHQVEVAAHRWRPSAEVVLRGWAGSRGPWVAELRRGPGLDAVELRVRAQDEAVLAAVTGDVRAIIESAA